MLVVLHLAGLGASLLTVYVYRTCTVVGYMFAVLFNMMLNVIITSVNVVSSGALLKVILCSYCPFLTATLV